MNFERRTKIIATIGPASTNPEVIRNLLLNGIDVARFNFSHGGPLAHAQHIERLRAIAADMEKPIAILQDLQGPKIRTGQLAEGEAGLNSGKRFVLTTRPTPGNSREVSTTYSKLPEDCKRGDIILLDDGYISLQVESTTETDVNCLVINGGVLKPNKGINLPGVQVSTPALSCKDRQDVEWAIRNKLDYVALSFVRRVEDVLELRRIANDLRSDIKIIAKIEKPEAMSNLKEIIQASDGVMVARGDLAVEVSTEAVPLMQKQIIQCANAQGKLVITATQMLESMTQSPRPTRAEATDVANAVLDGTDAVMLSGETASGAYPVEAVITMRRIVQKTESSFTNDLKAPNKFVSSAEDFPSTICQSAALAAKQLNAKAIVCFTETGSTARKLAKFRPSVPIVAFTPYLSVITQLQLIWGTRGFVVPTLQSTDYQLQYADEEMQRLGLASLNDKIVIVLGAPTSLHGSTNLMKIHRIGEDFSA